MSKIKNEAIEKVANKYNVDQNILKAVAELISENNTVEVEELIQSMNKALKITGTGF